MQVRPMVTFDSLYRVLDLSSLLTEPFVPVK